MISAVYKYRKIQDSNIQSKIRLAGCLTEEEVNKFLYIYKSTMDDLDRLFSADSKIKKMIGE